MCFLLSVSARFVLEQTITQGVTVMQSEVEGKKHAHRHMHT